MKLLARADNRREWALEALGVETSARRFAARVPADSSPARVAGGPFRLGAARVSYVRLEP